MLQNYCTLFDSKYLSRGLALYNSLKRNSKQFHLYIYPFDDKCYNELMRLKLENVTLISMKEFENDKLLSVKNDRTIQEYCWTCASSVLKHSIETFNLDLCTYLDSDIYFFNDPNLLLQELKDKSVLITDHRYTQAYDQVALRGKYCVQFLTIKNDEVGMKILNEWVNQCLDWCYAREEDGKFGDQKYLDDWILRYPSSVHELEHLGGGVAPWNIQQYSLIKENDKLILIEAKTHRKSPLIFYHFHDFKISNEGNWFFASGFFGYRIQTVFLEEVYSRYLKELFDFNIILDKNIKTDLPKVPNQVKKIEFEEFFLPKITNFDDFQYLKVMYKFDQDSESYILQNNQLQIDKKLFDIMISGNYNLDFFINGHLPVLKLVKDLERQVKEKELLLKSLHRFANELQHELRENKFDYKTKYSLLPEKFLSIIIPTYNQGPFIEDCLKSILSQSFKDYEVIIQDSNSTDETESICKKYIKKDPRVKYFREKDEGQSDAINRGLGKSSGDFWTWICSDDRYHANPDALKNMIEHLYSKISESSKIVGVYGNAFYMSEKGEVLNEYGNFKSDLKAIDFKHSWPLSQPSSILLTSRVREVNCVDKNLFLGMDLDLFIKMLKDDNQFTYLDIDVVDIRLQENSKSVKYQKDTAINALMIVKKHFGDIGNIHLSAYFKGLLHHADKKEVRKLLSEQNFSFRLKYKILAILEKFPIILKLIRIIRR